MRTIHYDTMVFEVTRRCNMACKHCMRGDAQCVDMSDEVIDKALENVGEITNITFTGGEPTLNVQAIRHVLDVCKAREIPVYSFYLVTNGKTVTTDFLTAMIEWYAYTQKFDGDYSAVALSRDIFHEDIPSGNRYLLRSLSFYNEEDKNTDFTIYSPQELGRARSMSATQPRCICEPDYTIDGQDIFFADGLVTVTADGLYLPVCDYEYAETERIAMGSVYDNEAYEQFLCDGITDSYWNKIDAA